MTNNKEDRAEEIEILRQMLDWYMDESIDMDSIFRSSLHDSLRGLADCLGFVEIDATRTSIVIRWKCLICKTNNKLETDYHDEMWSDVCKECGCNYALAPPDF